MFTRESMFPSLPYGGREKNHTKNDRCEWVKRVTFHKREKTAFRRQERKRGKKNDRKGCVSNREYAYATSRPIIDRRPFGCFIVQPSIIELYLYQKSAVLRAIPRKLRYIEVVRATCAHPRSQAV